MWIIILVDKFPLVLTSHVDVAEYVFINYAKFARRAELCTPLAYCTTNAIYLTCIIFLIL